MSGLLFLTVNTQYKYEKPRRNSASSKGSKNSLKSKSKLQHHRGSTANSTRSKHMQNSLAKSITSRNSSTVNSVYSAAKESISHHKQPLTHTPPPQAHHSTEDTLPWEALINNHKYKLSKFFTRKNINILRYTYFIELSDDCVKIEDHYAPKRAGFASFQFNGNAPRAKLSDDVVDPHTLYSSELRSPIDEHASVPKSIRSLLSSSNAQFWNDLYQDLKMDKSIFASIPSFEVLLAFLIDLIDAFLEVIDYGSDDNGGVRVSSCKQFAKLYQHLNTQFNLLGPAASNSKLLLKVIEELVENIRIYQLRTKPEFYEILSEFLRFLLLHLLAPDNFSSTKSSAESVISTSRNSIFLPQLDPLMSASSSINSNPQSMVPRQASLISAKDDVLTISQHKLSTATHSSLANYLLSSASDTTISLDQDHHWVTPPPIPEKNQQLRSSLENTARISASSETVPTATPTASTNQVDRKSKTPSLEYADTKSESTPAEKPLPPPVFTGTLGPARKDSKYFLRPPSDKRKRFLDRFKRIQDSESKGAV